MISYGLVGDGCTAAFDGRGRLRRDDAVRFGMEQSRAGIGSRMGIALDDFTQLPLCWLHRIDHELGGVVTAQEF